MEEQDLDFVVVTARVPRTFVSSLSRDTEWTVLSGKHGARAKLARMQQIIDLKDQELAELEDMLNGATQSIMEFHGQQQELYSEFVELRERYDRVKKHLRASLWVHALGMSREFSVIPPLLQTALEDEATIEQRSGSGRVHQVI